jgi:endo-1,4-beta-xylanase
VGTALNAYRILEKDDNARPLIEKHFNTISPENDMKWERIHPEEDRYDFKLADRFVELGEKHQMYLVAHCLVWHNQTPDWVFEDDNGELVSRDILLERMRDHIHTVVGRYKGRIDAWDVVNEAVTDDGELRKSRWYKIVGEDYIEKAFQYASEADPEALLIYNDYSLAGKAKREGTIRMVKKLQSAGINIGAIGMQAHYQLEDPELDEVEASIIAFSALDLEVMITELDISVLPSPYGSSVAQVNGRFQNSPQLDPYTSSLPGAVQEQLAARYKDLFGLFLKHADKISRVTFWGVDDGTSWKNNHPVRGRTNYPLLFDRQYRPKPAFEAVVGLRR